MRRWIRAPRPVRRNGVREVSARPRTLRQRLADLDWEALEASLWERGYARTRPLLAAAECREVIALYDEEQRFRKTVDMESHRFGRGEYKYFCDPLPASVAALRTHTYPYLAPVANRMAEALGRAQRFPLTHAAFQQLCRRHGQIHPTPLMLRYGPGGYNCLHQDLYGDLAFPFQLACFLSEPERDYQGGAFLLVENRPRAQAAGEAFFPRRGELVIFATAERPRQGPHGFHRASLRHGVATVTAGERYTLGVIFHDARK